MHDPPEVALTRQRQSNGGKCPDRDRMDEARCAEAKSPRYKLVPPAPTRSSHHYRFLSSRVSITSRRAYYNRKLARILSCMPQGCGRCIHELSGLRVNAPLETVANRPDSELQHIVSADAQPLAQFDRSLPALTRRPTAAGRPGSSGRHVAAAYESNRRILCHIEVATGKAIGRKWSLGLSPPRKPHQSPSWPR
jgi:hypothetical protein